MYFSLFLFIYVCMLVCTFNHLAKFVYIYLFSFSLSIYIYISQSVQICLSTNINKDKQTSGSSRFNRQSPEEDR